MTYSEYCASLRGKTAAVLGIGVSNRPLLQMLAASGAKVTACDKKSREQLGGIAEELEALGIRLQLGEDYLKGLDQELLFRSPSFRPDHPDIAAATAKGSRLTGEMEVFFDVCPCPIFAVTGSDGKTTTTTLIERLLTAQGYTCHLGGNIGHPLLCDTPQMQPDHRAVVELSSFQLMTMTRCADVAVVTNVSPNHLDIHKGMEEYVDCKARVFRNQEKSGRLVLNRDNEITRGFAKEAKGEVFWFSRSEAVPQGCYLDGETVYWTEHGAKTPLLTRKDIRIRGIHNVDNYMAAICAVRPWVQDETIRTVAAEFGGVEHRQEFVRELHGVSYYNDSIASSPTRMMAALEAFPGRLIAIAGGYDKQIPFDALGPAMAEHLKVLVLCGQTAPKLRAALEAAPNYDPAETRILECGSLEDAVRLAQENAEEGDTVLLSPACAAFDQFPNFMVRGQKFKELVNRLV